jgi:hypothetical protein
MVSYLNSQWNGVWNPRSIRGWDEDAAAAALSSSPAAASPREEVEEV